MIPIKQNTSLAMAMFAFDANGDAVAGLLDAGFTKRISKAGGAFAAMTVTITEMTGVGNEGWYSWTLSTSHTDTLGVLSITLTHTSCKQLNFQWRVTARVNDDYAFPTTTGRSIDVSASGEVALDFTNTAGTLAKTTHITGFNDLSAAEVNAEVDTALNTAIPGSPTAGSINERLVALDDYYTATRAAYLDELAAANIPANVDALTVSIAALPTAQNIEDEVLNANASLHVAGGSIGELINDVALFSQVAGLEDLTAAQVNAEIVDALNVDTYAEPGAGAPAATNTIAGKLGYLFKGWRNRKTATASLATVFNDDTTTPAHTAALSDDGSTFDHGEWGA